MVPEGCTRSGKIELAIGSDKAFDSFRTYATVLSGVKREFLDSIEPHLLNFTMSLFFTT